MGQHIEVINHPLITHKLSIMRDKSTPPVQFRLLLKEISMLLAYEVSRDLPVESVEIETPIQKMSAMQVNGKSIAIVSILRAGNGILDGILELIPTARVGHIGLYRDPETLQPVEYYRKLPDTISKCQLIVVDPMLATGHSASAAISILKEQAPGQPIKMVCLLAAPEGVKELSRAHPDITIYTAAVDEKLNDHGYIVPGLGDAGDRIYGTK